MKDFENRSTFDEIKDKRAVSHRGPRLLTAVN